MKNLIYLTRGIIFTLLFVTTTFIITASFSPFLFFKRHILYLASIIWSKTTTVLLRIICGIKYKVTGRENLPKYPYIVASKHQSAFETAFFWDLFYVPTFILKKELTKIPLFGSYLTNTGMIAIDRSAGASALKKILSEADKHLKDKRKIIIYPEGTRTIAGSAEPRYSSGVAALYKHCNVPIVPVALNSGMCWPSGKWTKYPGTIEVRILPPIHPGLDKEAFMSKLTHDIEKASSELYHLHKIKHKDN